MLTGQPRSATALAVTDCVLFYINQQDFNHVARKWPKALSTILAKAKERLLRINNSNSTALAAQLGQRLSEVRLDIASGSGAILGMQPAASTSSPPPARGGNEQRESQVNMCETRLSGEMSFIGARGVHTSELHPALARLG